MAAPGGEWPLVGRDAHVAVIDAVLARRPATGLVLAGPAGFGKTRLLHECVSRAHASGRPTSVAVATAALSHVPLGALAPLAQGDGSRPERLVDLVARIRRSVVALGTGPDGAAPVLVVDDGHLLDDVSAGVLLQMSVAREASAVTAVRVGEQAPDAIQALWKDGLAERVDVGPLSPAEVDELAELVLGGRISAGSSRELWRVSLGNPLFVRELLLGATEDRYLVQRDGVWRFTTRLSGTPRLTEIIEARLGQVTEAERWALELLTVAGNLDLEVLRHLVDTDVLEHIEQRGLLEVTREGSGRTARLAHPLYADVLGRDMRELKAMAVNRALADAMEALGPQGDDVVRSAVWRMDGGGQAPPELMLQAARQAHFNHDEVLAVRVAAAAREAGAGVAATLVEAQALRQLGRNVEVAALLEQALVDASTDEQLGVLASELAVTLRWSLGRRADAAATLEGAAAAMTDQSWRDEVSGVLATFELLGGQPSEALVRAAPLLDRCEGRPLVVAAVAAGPALAIVGRADAAMAVAQRGLDARLALGQQEALDGAGIHVVTQALALSEAGRLAAAAELCRAGAEAATIEGSATGEAWFNLLGGRVALMQGRLLRALRAFGESASLFSDLDQPGNRRWAVGGLVLAAAALGDRERAAAAHEALEAVPSMGVLMMEPDMERAHAWAALLAGDPAAARAHLVVAVDLARDSGAASLEAAAWHDMARLGDPVAAAAGLASVVAHVDGELVHARSAYASGVAGSDAAALDSVTDAFEDQGALLFAAEAAAAAAAAWRRAGVGRAAQQRATRSRTLAARCDGAQTPALVGGGAAAALTRREHEIASLAAMGQANKDIASTLVVSVRTIENHLQRAYEKLGVRSRAELADALSAHGGFE